MAAAILYLLQPIIVLVIFVIFAVSHNYLTLMLRMIHVD